MSPSSSCCRGVTLLELLVVLLVLAAVAGVVVPALSNAKAGALEAGTRQSLIELRDAVVGTREAPGYFSDLGVLPETTADLLRVPLGLPPRLRAYDPDTRQGWRGPYVRNALGTYRIEGDYTDEYGSDGDPAVLDAWGHPIVLQTVEPGSFLARIYKARWVSAGPNGAIDTSRNSSHPNPDEQGDDLVVFLRAPMPP